MATLLELNTIEINSLLDPGGDPLADPPVPPDPDIVAARALRAKVRSAVLKRCGTIMATALPSTDPERSAALELLAWAQQAVANPEPATGAVFRLALGRAPGAATTAGITGATDQTIEDGITPILPLLVKGLHPGTR